MTSANIQTESLAANLKDEAWFNKSEYPFKAN